MNLKHGWTRYWFHPAVGERLPWCRKSAAWHNPTPLASNLTQKELVCLLGELHAEILADEGTFPLVQFGDLFPFLYLQLAGIHIDQHMRMVAVQAICCVTVGMRSSVIYESKLLCLHPQCLASYPFWRTLTVLYQNLHFDTAPYCLMYVLEIMEIWRMVMGKCFSGDRNYIVGQVWSKY